MRLGTQLKAQSSVYGKIEQLLLVYPGDPVLATPKSIECHFGDLFSHFGDRVTFVILSNFNQVLEGRAFHQAREQFQHSFREALFASHLHPDHHVVHLPAPMAVSTKNGNVAEPTQHSTFVQDPFVVMQDSYGNTALLESYRNLNPGNQFVAEQVAAATGMLIRPTELWLESGNVLVGGDFALAGMNLLHTNRDLLFHGRALEDKVPGNGLGGKITVKEAITGMLKRQLGVRYLTWIGLDKPMALPFQMDQGKHRLQAFFHLDHYLTLGGITSKGDELVMVGRIRPKHIHGIEEKHQKGINLLNEQLQKVYDLLKRSGRDFPGPRFEVVRLPMGGQMQPLPNGEVRFIPFSYNNCQVEWYHGVRRIYMPKYPSTEALEKKVKERVGAHFPPFQFINYDLEGFSRSGGSLHCLAKVLKRSFY